MMTNCHLKQKIGIELSYVSEGLVITEYKFINIMIK